MKTRKRRVMMAASATALLLALPGPMDGAPASTDKTESFTGKIVQVNDLARTVKARGFWFWSSRTFEVGNSCTVVVGDNLRPATLKDLAPGNAVDVQFTSVGGVDVASQIAESYRHFTGHIVAIGRGEPTLTVRHGSSTKAFVLARECQVLENGEQGMMRDLKPGHQVTIAYTAAGVSIVAHQIAQNSRQFIGRVEAIDAEARTLKAEHLMTDHRFRLADDCAIVIDGRPGGHLRDLRIGDTVMFNYDDVDGVCIANRIARGAEPANNGTGPTARNESSEHRH